MPQTYVRLTGAEREEISRGLSGRTKVTVMAKSLGRSVSTISREVSKGGGKYIYRAEPSMRRAKRRATSRRYGKRKLDDLPKLKDCVFQKINERWSPDQVAKTLKATYPEDASMRISHEALYQYIYVLPKGTLKKTLTKALRQERRYRHKRKTIMEKEAETRGKIADMLSIEERPGEVADRIVPGHGEGDLIIGKYKQSAIGTFVERTTRYTLIVPLKAKDAHCVRRAFAKEIQTLPVELRKTLTYDQGKEMSEHKKFTRSTGMQVYFAHPGSPWERGTNENTNGLIRQYFPKGTDFRTMTTKELKLAQRQLNGRPRMTLNYQTPEEEMNKLVALKS